MIDVPGTAVHNAETAGIVGLMVGKARVTDVAAIFLVQRVVHFADNRPVGLAKRRAANLVARKPERGRISWSDRDGIWKSVGIVLKLSEEKELVFDNRPAKGKGYVIPAGVWLNRGKRRDRLKIAGPPLSERGAMKFIRAGFHHHVDLAAGSAAELSRIAIRDCLRLRDCLRRHNNEANLTVATMLRIIQTIQVPLRTLRSTESELRG